MSVAGLGTIGELTASGLNSQRRNCAGYPQAFTKMASLSPGSARHLRVAVERRDLHLDPYSSASLRSSSACR